MILLEADAATLSPEETGARSAAAGGRERSGAALAVVDLQEPTGVFSVLTPLVRLACRLGGSDIHAHPWRALEGDCTDVAATSARGGHLRIRAGRRRPDPLA